MKKLLIKLLLMSALLSYLVKYGGRFLPMEANNINAIIAIITPSLLMAILLFLRSQKIVGH